MPPVDRGPRADAPCTAVPVGIGILGCSDIARRKFVPALLWCRDAALAAVASRSPAKAAAFIPGQTYEVRSYEELVSDPHVQLVYISLPNDLHEEWVMRALEGGKHVICEKPLGLHMGSVEQAVATAARKGLLLYENLMFIHHPQHRLVRNLVRTGKIGRVVSLRSVFGFPTPPPTDFRMNPSQGGGAFHDLARYPIGTALYFLEGELDAFTGLRMEEEHLTVGMHGVSVSTRNEVFTFSIAFGQQYESYYELIGEKGKIRVDRAYTTPADLANPISVTCGGTDASFTAPADDHFRGMLDHVCGLIQAGGSYDEEHGALLQRARLAELMDRGCRTAV